MEIILHENDTNISDEVVVTPHLKELESFYIEYLRAYETAYLATSDITYEVP